MQKRDKKKAKPSLGSRRQPEAGGHLRCLQAAWLHYDTKKYTMTIAKLQKLIYVYDAETLKNIGLFLPSSVLNTLKWVKTL